MSRLAGFRALASFAHHIVIGVSTSASTSTSFRAPPSRALALALARDRDREHHPSLARARTFASALTVEGGVTPAFDAVPESFVRASESRRPAIDLERGFVVAKKAGYAVVQIRSMQFKVSPDDVIFVDKMTGFDVNDIVSLPRVLMVGNRARTVIGRPCVPGAEVLAVVEEQLIDGKKIIFKKKRRKNYRRRTGFRAQLTGLRVLEVNGIEEE